MSKHYEGDLEFGLAGQFNHMYRALAEVTREPSFLPIVAAYVGNMDRVSSICILPVEVSYWSNMAVSVAASVRFDHGFGPIDKSGAADIERTIEYLNRMQPFLDRRKANDPEVLDAAWKDGTIFLRQMIREFGPGDSWVSMGAESALYSMVLGSYAAFEVLATDLWVQTLNLFPAAFRAFDAGSNAAKLGVIRAQLATQVKPGEWLQEQGKAKFHSRTEILKSYELTFGPASKIYGCLDPNNGLMTAEKVRHIIAHKNGAVDQKFKLDLDGKSDYANIPVGVRLPLDGPQTATIIDSCVETVVRLIVAVDSWCVNYGS